MSKLNELKTRTEAMLTEHPDGLEGQELVEFEELTRQIEREQNLARIEELAKDPRNIEHGTQGMAEKYSREVAAAPPGSRTTGEAMRTIERWRADDEVKQAATTALEQTDEQEAFSRHILLTGNPEYVSAFHKHIADPETGYQTFTDAERRAWGDVKAYQRTALGLSGAVLPSPLDPALILTNASVIDPMRRLARTDRTASNTKRYVTTAGVTASFDGELTEVSDDTPTLAEVEITTHKAQAFVQASIEAAMDQPDFASVEVPRLMADAKRRLEGDKFINGTGTNEPFGIWTRLNGASGELSPATTETFASADVYSTAEALPERWRPSARWQAELSTINQIDQQESGNGAKLFPRVGDANPVLLRRGLAENSTVSAHSGINPAVTADNPILWFGDWNQYVILDRIGGTLEFIPHMFNTTTNLPDGRRGWYYYWRTGADVLTSNAFVVMNIATTA